MILCMVILCVDFVYLVTGWLELWLAWAGASRALSERATVIGWLELRWVSTRAVLGLFTQRSYWQDS